jgi:hypothetical protein
MRKVDNWGPKEPTRSGWPLYASFAIVLGLLWLERRSSLTPADHTLALIGIVVAFFALAVIWLAREGSL